MTAAVQLEPVFHALAADEPLGPQLNAFEEAVAVESVEGRRPFGNSAAAAALVAAGSRLAAGPLPFHKTFPIEYRIMTDVTFYCANINY